MAACCRPTARTTWLDHDLLGIRDGRIQQLDLDADDWMDPGGLCRTDETDSTVQPAMIGDRQPGQAQLECSIDDLVGRGCAIEKREVGVAMKLGVMGLSHESPGRTGRLGASHHRTNVLVLAMKQRCPA